MAGGDSPNVRAKGDTKEAFDQLLIWVMAELEMGPRGLTQDQLLHALVLVGKDHPKDLVAAARQVAARQAG